MTTGILPARSCAWYLLVALLCVSAATACGSVPASGQANVDAAGHASVGAASAAARLVIEVTRHPGAKPQRWTLTCDPAGGTHPHARAACRVLERAKNPFAPADPSMMCPPPPASPTATIRGTWFGHLVDATYTQNGCGLSRWRRMSPVFP
jgi:Subtilisin inhibitor-like